MATIAKAVRDGALEVHRLPEWETRNAIRLLYVAPEFYQWVDKTDALHVVLKDGSRRSTFDHIEQLMADICCSDQPAAGGIRRMMPTNKGIWKIHGVNCRMYGWCCAPNTLVLVTGALEGETKNPDRHNDAEKNINNLKRDFVSAFIRRHSLAETVVRGDIRAVFPKSN